MKRRTNALLKHTGKYLDQILGEDMHAARVASLANATVGAIEARALAIHLIGQGLATCRGLDTKHSIKQVDRLLSNVGVNVWRLFELWVPHVVSSRFGWRLDGDGRRSTLAPSTI